MIPTKMIPSDLRSETRRKTFLTAELTHGGVSVECRIRNMSARGALVQTTLIPPIAAELTINRGALVILGTVVWQGKGCVGVHFPQAVHVQDWLQEVSGIDKRSDARLPIRRYLEGHAEMTARTPVQSLDEQTFVDRLSDELSYVARMLECVSELLVCDPLLRVRHATSLQNLVSGQQMLTELSRVVVSKDDKVAAVKSLTTGSMRQRLLRQNL